MNNKLYLIGYSGHAFVCAEVALSNGYSLEGYYELREMVNNPFAICYKGKGESINSNQNVFIAIGENLLRKKLFVDAISNGNIIPYLIHPKSNFSEYAAIEAGAIICAGAIVNPFVRIGSATIINSGSIIEHECQIGNFSHIAPGAVLAGNVKVGELCFIGANSVIKQGLSICDNVIIGMGAVVTKDITEPGTYIGSPAKKLIK
jgi:sugar O-acyltransferase (sialic acid O-acetyltransferase NeuD family)